MKSCVCILVVLLGCGETEPRPAEDAGSVTVPAPIRCASAAECVVPTSCSSSDCVGGLCAYAPAGCAGSAP